MACCSRTRARHIQVQESLGPFFEREVILLHGPRGRPDPIYPAIFASVGARRVKTFVLQHNLNLKRWNSQAHGGFPGKFESSNVSRDSVSREIGYIC